MVIYPNHTRRQLEAGKTAIGMGLRLARTVDIATIGKTCGYDWLFIDMEHNSMDVPMDVHMAAQISMAALAGRHADRARAVKGAPVSASCKASGWALGRAFSTSCMSRMMSRQPGCHSCRL